MQRIEKAEAFGGSFAEMPATVWDYPLRTCPLRVPRYAIFVDGRLMQKTPSETLIMHLDTPRELVVNVKHTGDVLFDGTVSESDRGGEKTNIFGTHCLSILARTGSFSLIDNHVILYAHDGQHITTLWVFIS